MVKGSECEDWNDKDEDGCSTLCQIEKGWSCDQDPSICKPICGDGFIVPFYEECEDLN